MFMRHMNRVIVGTMLDVASGRSSLDDFVGLLTGRLAARPADGSAAWPRACPVAYGYESLAR